MGIFYSANIYTRHAFRSINFVIYDKGRIDKIGKGDIAEIWDSDDKCFRRAWRISS